MENYVEKFEIDDNRTLYICQDTEDVTDPRTDCENMSQFIFWHKGHVIGDKHEFKSPAEFEEYLEGKKHFKFLVYMLDHSGVAFSLSNTVYPFDCQWDVSTVGYAVVTEEKWLEIFGQNPNVLFTEEKVYNMIAGELEVYNQFVTGDVYGYVLMENKTCDLGHEHEEVIDSCWGFFGHDFLTNGMLDSLDSEVANAVREELGEGLRASA